MDIVESTSDRLVIREQPHSLGAVVAIALGMMALAIGIRSDVPARSAAVFLCGALCALMLAIGAFALIRSEISIDRGGAHLTVQRKLVGLVFWKSYAIEEIAEIFVSRGRSGAGLGVRLGSGKERRLSLQTEDFELVEGYAAMLNEFVAGSKQLRKPPKHRVG